MIYKYHSHYVATLKLPMLVLYFNFLISFLALLLFLCYLIATHRAVLLLTFTAALNLLFLVIKPYFLIFFYFYFLSRLVSSVFESLSILFGYHIEYYTIKLNLNMVSWSSGNVGYEERHARGSRRAWDREEISQPSGMHVAHAESGIWGNSATDIWFFIILYIFMANGHEKLKSSNKINI